MRTLMMEKRHLHLRQKSCRAHQTVTLAQVSTC